MKLSYKNDTTLYKTKKNANQNKKNKLKNTITFLFKNLNRKSKQPLAIYRYHLLSSFVYLQLATETFNYTIFGI